MRRLALAVAILSAGGGTAVAAIRPAVLPMDARVFLEQPSDSLAIQFSGRVPAARGGDRIVMLARDCQSRYFRQVGGTTTTDGGVWSLKGGGASTNGFFLAGSGATYQARWKGRLTAPFTYRARMKPFVFKYSATQFSTWFAIPFGEQLVPMAGRTVALQRLGDSGWVTIRTLRLRRDPADIRRFNAQFTVATPNLTLRVLASARTARPCYNGGASDIVRSG